VAQIKITIPGFGEHDGENPITWNHPETSMKVTTYPMLHIGHDSFYRRMSVTFPLPPPHG